MMRSASRRRLNPPHTTTHSPKPTDTGRDRTATPLRNGSLATRRGAGVEPLGKASLFQRSAEDDAHRGNWRHHCQDIKQMCQRGFPWQSSDQSKRQNRVNSIDLPATYVDGRIEKISSCHANRQDAVRQGFKFCDCKRDRLHRQRYGIYFHRNGTKVNFKSKYWRRKNKETRHHTFIQFWGRRQLKPRKH